MISVIKTVVLALSSQPSTTAVKLNVSEPPGVATVTLQVSQDRFAGSVHMKFFILSGPTAVSSILSPGQIIGSSGMIDRNGSITST